MIFELIKYVYGLKPRRYTAFELRPVSNGGRGRCKDTAVKMVSRHYSSPEAAKAWLQSAMGKLLNPDWCLLPGTGILRPGGKAK